MSCGESPVKKPYNKRAPTWDDVGMYVNLYAHGGPVGKVVRPARNGCFDVMNQGLNVCNATLAQFIAAGYMEGPPTPRRKLTLLDLSAANLRAEFPLGQVEDVQYSPDMEAVYCRAAADIRAGVFLAQRGTYDDDHPYSYKEWEVGTPVGRHAPFPTVESLVNVPEGRFFWVVRRKTDAK
jgi:hypothetical protein